MDDYVAVVEHGPTTTRVIHPIQLQWANVLLHAQLLQHILLDRAGLAHRINRGDNKIIRQRSLFVNIQQDNVVGLFFFNNVYNLTGKGETIQDVPPIYKFASNSFSLKCRMSEYHLPGSSELPGRLSPLTLSVDERKFL
jgi:hypothetical protein